MPNLTRRLLIPCVFYLKLTNAQLVSIYHLHRF